MLSSLGKRVPSTPTSGRKWGPKVAKVDGDSNEIELEAAAGGKGGGASDGGGDDGGRRNLTIKLLEEELKMMKQNMENMKATNEILKAEIEVLKKNMPQHQNQDNKDKREKGGWWVEDAWKDWKKRDETTKGGDERINDDGKWGHGKDKGRNWDDEWFNDEGEWEKKTGRGLKDERAKRIWWDGRFDRRNEMVAMGV